MKKNLLLLLLTGVFCFGVLTGCGDKESSSVSESTSEVEEAVTDVQESDSSIVSTDDSESIDSVSEASANDTENADSTEEETDDSAEDDSDEEFAEFVEDFLQEQTGISTFKDYDDVISYLSSGEGYAYVKLDGYDDDILLITDMVFSADNSSSQASVYALGDNGAVNIGTVFGNGSGYPLRYSDGIIYGGDNHTYESYFLSNNTGILGIMLKDYVTDGINDGSTEYSGFLRETNDFDHDKDFTGGEEEFNALLEARENAPIIEFTIVK